MLINNSEYFQILKSVKAAIQTAQYKAVLGANREQILLYWNIGNIIIENSEYGSRFVENLARDIKLDFPDATGYSVRNLRYMKKFASLVTDEEKVQTVSAVLTWSHNKCLFDKTKSFEEYLWYGVQTIENGWSLSSLEYYVTTKTYERQAISDKIANFGTQLPAPQSNLQLKR